MSQLCIYPDILPVNQRKSFIFFGHESVILACISIDNKKIIRTLVLFSPSRPYFWYLRLNSLKSFHVIRGSFRGPAPNFRPIARDLAIKKIVFLRFPPEELVYRTSKLN